MNQETQRVLDEIRAEVEKRINHVRNNLKKSENQNNTTHAIGGAIMATHRELVDWLNEKYPQKKEGE